MGNTHTEPNVKRFVSGVCDRGATRYGPKCPDNADALKGNFNSQMNHNGKNRFSRHTGTHLLSRSAPGSLNYLAHAKLFNQTKLMTGSTDDIRVDQVKSESLGDLTQTSQEYDHEQLMESCRAMQSMNHVARTIEGILFDDFSLISDSSLVRFLIENTKSEAGRTIFKASKRRLSLTSDKTANTGQAATPVSLTEDVQVLSVVSTDGKNSGEIFSDQSVSTSEHTINFEEDESTLQSAELVRIYNAPEAADKCMDITPELLMDDCSLINDQTELQSGDHIRNNHCIDGSNETVVDNQTLAKILIDFQTDGSTNPLMVNHKNGHNKEKSMTIDKKDPVMEGEGDEPKFRKIYGQQKSRTPEDRFRFKGPAASIADVLLDCGLVLHHGTTTLLPETQQTILAQHKTCGCAFGYYSDGTKKLEATEMANQLACVNINSFYEDYSLVNDIIVSPQNQILFENGATDLQVDVHKVDKFKVSTDVLFNIWHETNVSEFDDCTLIPTYSFSFSVLKMEIAECSLSSNDEHSGDSVCITASNIASSILMNDVTYLSPGIRFAIKHVAATLCEKLLTFSVCCVQPSKATLRIALSANNKSTVKQAVQAMERISALIDKQPDKYTSGEMQKLKTQLPHFGIKIRLKPRSNPKSGLLVLQPETIGNAYSTSCKVPLVTQNTRKHCATGSGLKNKTEAEVHMQARQPFFAISNAKPQYGEATLNQSELRTSDHT